MPKIKSKQKNKKTTVIILAILFISFIVWVYFNTLDFSHSDKPVTFGVTFSHKYASDVLGMDWTEVYWNIINDLHPKHLRLVAHWDKIEEGNNEYNFNDLDWMLDQALKKDIKVVLAVGRRTPRWPECHDPGWIKDLSKAEQDQHLLQMIEKVVSHYKKYDNVIAWQVENEPFLKIFGECPQPDEDLLRQEIELVRSIDDRPIITTDAGELSSWSKAASMADIFGTTMYKTVWNRFIGVWRYPLPPAFYYYKSLYIKNKYDLDKIIVSELQAEPWVPGDGSIIQMPLYDQFNSFSLADFRRNLEFVAKAGFEECYLWGAEWWYWLKTKQDHPEFWNYAKSIWQD